MVTLRTGLPLRDQIMGVRRASQNPCWISINSQPLSAPDTADSGAVISTFVDVTAQRETFAQIRALAQRLENVREDERRASAQALHEGIAQDLFAMRLMLKQLEKESKGRARVERLCTELGVALEQCMVDTRQIANDLRPASLEHLPLAQALREHGRYFGELSGLKITVAESAEFPFLNEATRLLFFRAAQEALTNVARHASANRVEIKMRADGERVSMSVSDNGIGIKMGATPRPGALGLLGLRERFAACGGGMTLQSATGLGTTITVYVPRISNV
jgi:signal transduction histidine kinase